MNTGRKITIVTPTYNRAKELSELYKSLLEQTKKDFIWLIIDDGSTDNTKEVTESFDQKTFPIVYVEKLNGGKHTAINYSMNYITTELTMIVDSDDYLTKNAIDIILKEWKCNSAENLAGMILLKEDVSGKLSGFKFPKERFIGNINSFLLNNHSRGEVADVWVSEIFKRYPYPEFKGEKYLAETTIWVEISKDFNVLFINEVVYIFEYREGGLTKSGRRLRINNSKGSMLNSKVYLLHDFGLAMHLKKMLLYICYGFFSKCSIVEMYNNIPQKIMFIVLLPFGFLIKQYWEMFYK